MWDGKPLLGIQPSRPNHPGESPKTEAPHVSAASLGPWRNGRLLGVYLLIHARDTAFAVSDAAPKGSPRTVGTLSRCPASTWPTPQCPKKWRSALRMSVKAGCHLFCLSSSSDGFRTALRRADAGAHDLRHPRYSKTCWLDLVTDDGCAVCLFLISSLVILGRHSPWLWTQHGCPKKPRWALLCVRSDTQVSWPVLPASTPPWSRDTLKTPLTSQSRQSAGSGSATASRYLDRVQQHCMSLLTAYVTWSSSFQYQIQPQMSPGRSHQPLEASRELWRRPALGYVAEADHASYALLTTHVTWPTFS
ncbi:uncharacterized protein LOC119239386 [Talpa occidentalis]|uniref:uncharacterized protein LOC119239386 n=1 Tax=Talpa occidentalis TaxID=50954 RepID=UPI00188E2E82|nr:uncharacterized protein LOC119239386 [Talpa occidentalis]XP_054548291.1 uncharacterized protein LOC119239386 [Talpa occidentalis]XP_054548294.1 uncharacterized protein LOC119239386 [Talpa occidentalis]